MGDGGVLLKFAKSLCKMTYNFPYENRGGHCGGWGGGAIATSFGKFS